MKATTNPKIFLQTKLIFDRQILRRDDNPFSSGKRIVLLVVGCLFLYQVAAAATPVKPASPAITVSVEELEVIQSVQGPGNSVPLIANKPTLVRAYLKMELPNSVTVRGDLKITDASGAIKIVPSKNTLDLNSTTIYSLIAKRDDIKLSLNFPVPSELLSSSRLTFELSAIVDAASNSVLACSDCGVKKISIPFLKAPTLRVRVIGIRYKTNEEVPATFEPAPEDFKNIESWLRRAYPVASVEFSHTTVDAKIKRTDGTTDNNWPFDCNQVNAQLFSVRAEDVSNRNMDPRTHYYGLVSDGNVRIGDDFPFFMRGCAPVPISAPDPSTVASGPTGKSDWGWDRDGSYGDWYAGHELAHTFGRLHPGFCGDQAREDVNFQYSEGRISDTDPYFTGMDIDGTSFDALSGSKWHDVMTYCEKQWLSEYTYRAILRRLFAEEVFAPHAPLAIAPVARERRLNAVRFTAARMANVINAFPQVSTTDAQLADQPQARLVAGDLINVVGVINYSQKKVESLNRPIRLSKGIVLDQKDEAKIKLFDANDKLLAEYPASVRLSTDQVEKQDKKGLVNTLVPFVRGTAKVVLMYGETEARQTVSENPPTPTKPSNQGGAGIPGSAMQFAWRESIDPDGNHLTYTVEISADNKVWEVCATDLTETHWRLTPGTIKEKLDDSKNVWIRVVTSDGFNRAIGPSLKIR